MDLSRERISRKRMVVGLLVQSLPCNVILEYKQIVTVTDPGEGPYFPLPPPPPPPFIFRQPKARRAEENFGKCASPFSQCLDDRPSPLSKGLDPALSNTF